MVRSRTFLVLALALSSSLIAEDARGYQLYFGPLEEGRQLYRRAANFPIGAVQNTLRGEEAWEVQGLADVTDWEIGTATPGNDRVVVFWDTIDGPNGTLAFATAGCHSDLAVCGMTFDSDEAWNFVNVQTTAPAYDLWSLAAHEFGHWYGLHHCTDAIDADCTDFPSTDPSQPTMNPVFAPGDDFARNIAQDDANGFLDAHQSDDSILANNGFEHTFPFWGWALKPSAAGGNAVRYCNDGTAHTGNCFYEFNGNGGTGASVYQDIVFDHRPDDDTERVWFSALLRNRGTQITNVDIAVWELDRGENTTRRCTLIPTVWTFCQLVLAAVVENPQGSHLRFEIYNLGRVNLDVDTVNAWRAPI